MSEEKMCDNWAHCGKGCCAELPRLREELAAKIKLTAHEVSAAKAHGFDMERENATLRSELEAAKGLTSYGTFTDLGVARAALRQVAGERDEARAKLAAMENDSAAKERTRDQLSLSLNKALKEKFRMEELVEAAVAAEYHMRDVSKCPIPPGCGDVQCEFHAARRVLVLSLNALATPYPRPTEGKPAEDAGAKYACRKCHIAQSICVDCAPEPKPADKCDGPYCPTFPHSHEVECKPEEKAEEKP